MVGLDSLKEVFDDLHCVLVVETGIFKEIAG